MQFGAKLKAAPPEPDEPTTGASLETWDGYVASINSEVFHKPDCKGARKIALKNLPPILLESRLFRTATSRVWIARRSGALQPTAAVVSTCLFS